MEGYNIIITPENNGTLSRMEPRLTKILHADRPLRYLRFRRRGKSEKTSSWEQQAYSDVLLKLRSYSGSSSPGRGTPVHAAKGGSSVTGSPDLDAFLFDLRGGA